MGVLKTVRRIPLVGLTVVTVFVVGRSMFPGEAISITQHNKLEEKLELLRKDLKSGSLFDSYVAVKRLTIEIAEEVARSMIDKILKSYVLHDRPYHSSPEFRELAGVAHDAWPALESEWRIISSESSKGERKLKKRILKDCWHLTIETRALELLVRDALEENGIGGIQTVEYISGVYQGGIYAEMTAQQIQECRERFATWWESYKKKWRAEVEARRTLEGYWKKK